MVLLRQFHMRISRLLTLKSVCIAGLVSLIFTVWGFRGHGMNTVDTFKANEEIRQAMLHLAWSNKANQNNNNIKNVFNSKIEIPASNSKTSPVRSDALACTQPALDVNDPVMMKWFKKMPPIECKGPQDMAWVENGTIRFTADKTANHSCDMFPLIRGPGDYKYSWGPAVKNVQDKAPLVSDFFQVKCSLSGKPVYDNIHAGVHANKTIRERLDSIKPPANGLGLSVVMLGFDSMSRMSWLRRMPKTRDYFVNKLGAVELEGYNIMGDGTPAALFPILTGKHEQELPEARRGFKGAKPVDDFPWIWKDFQKNGYVTSWGDAEINIAPFNYRLLGFQHSPADFFLRPYFLSMAKNYKKYTKGCHGSVTKHQYWFNFARDIIHMYKNDPKFIFHFYATLSHGNNNPITQADEDLYKTLVSLEEGGFLENTLFVLFADHGARFSSVRGTLAGKLEERMPYFALRFPKSFVEKRPDLMTNLRTNVKRLTSPMDIHETLKDMLRFDGAGMGDVKNRGISLFKEIPKERTCGHADIAPHWCSCLAWKPVEPGNEDGQKALAKAIDTINGYTALYRDDCAELKVLNVTGANTLKTSDSVLRFKQTTGDRGLQPVMNDNSVKNNKVVFQLTFYTTPGEGHFEVTVEHSLDKNEMTISPKAISRINKYGDAPACVLEKNREIRQYCYCNNLLKPQEHPIQEQKPVASVAGSVGTGGK